MWTGCGRGRAGGELCGGEEMRCEPEGQRWGGGERALPGDLGVMGVVCLSSQSLELQSTDQRPSLLVGKMDRTWG